MYACSVSNFSITMHDYGIIVTVLLEYSSSLQVILCLFLLPTIATWEQDGVLVHTVLLKLNHQETCPL